MQTPKLKNLLLAAACNAEYESFAWQGGLVAFGSSSLVHLYSQQAIKTLAALRGHTGRVNNVKFLKSGAIVSVCSEGRIILHRNADYKPGEDAEFLKKEESWPLWINAAQVDLKGKNIVQFSLLETEQMTIGAFLTTESDLHLFRIDETANKFVPLDRLLFGNNLLEASAIILFKGTTYLFVSSSDFMVHVYRLSNPGQQNEAMDGKSLTFLNSLKGHEDKVKCLAAVVCTDQAGEQIGLVASGSKDNSIRVWRITETLTDKISNEFIKKNIYKIGEHYLHLESNLHGHGDAVSSVQWSYTSAEKRGQEEGLVLLSSSFDFSVQVWQRETQSKVWMNIVRLGQLGGNKNSFFGAQFNAETNKILACTFTGCFYIWNATEGIREWTPAPTITGHARQVSDIDWGNNSQFLVSTSHDQTSRIYTWWNNPKLAGKSWHEVSRAQVHGYDINAIKFLSIENRKSAGDKRNLCSLLVCGADEKILRILEPPAPFVNTVNAFTDAKLRLYYPNPEDEAPILEDKEKFIYKTKTEGGYSVLGLMIKATKVEKVTCFFHDDEEDVEEMENNFDIPYDYKTPPIEDYLYKHTLWPEINKLYGHGYEIESVATNHDGTLIASTCDSQTAAHSAIFLWDPQTCQLVQKLSGHNYTVLQVRFSRSGNYLCAVSRDRQTSLFKKGSDGQFAPVFLQNTHAKLIYSVAMSADDKLLAAGSRDKSLKIWTVGESLTDLATVKLEDGITSLEFASKAVDGGHLLWVGLENGKIKVFKVNFAGEVKELMALEGHWNHQGTIKAIRYGFRNEEDNSHVVATCGEDHSVRIYEYHLGE